MNSTLVQVYRTLKFKTNKCYAYTDKKLGEGVEKGKQDPTTYYAEKEHLKYLGKYVETTMGHGGSDGSNAYNHFNNNGEETVIGYDYGGDSTWFAEVECEDLSSESSECVGCSISGGTRNKKRKNRKSIRRKTNRRKSIRRKSIRSR